MIEKWLLVVDCHRSSLTIPLGIVQVVLVVLV